jgi:predicted transcriptional regulator
MGMMGIKRLDFPCWMIVLYGLSIGETGTQIHYKYKITYSHVSRMIGYLISIGLIIRDENSNSNRNRYYVTSKKGAMIAKRISQLRKIIFGKNGGFINHVYRDVGVKYGAYDAGDHEGVREESEI